MKSSICVDTSYILALANTADQYHECARATSLLVSPPFLTTEAILVEIGNALSKASWRRLGVATLNDLRTDPDIQIVPVSTELFERAAKLYSKRLDREWGLTIRASNDSLVPHTPGGRPSPNRAVGSAEPLEPVMHFGP